MTNYTTTDSIIEQIFQLSRVERGRFFQRLFHAFIKHDTKILIKLLRQKGVTDAEIAKTLEFDAAVLTRNFPK